MEKTANSVDFLDFGYSPINMEETLKQRIINPKKKKIIIYGVRYIRHINEKKELKITRKKYQNNII